MANHKSALKRIRSNETKRLRNKYQHKTTRNAVRKLRAITDKKEAEGMFTTVVSMLDKLAKNNISDLYHRLYIQKGFSYNQYRIAIALLHCPQNIFCNLHFSTSLNPCSLENDIIFDVA